jgi:TolB protein
MINSDGSNPRAVGVQPDNYTAATWSPVADVLVYYHKLRIKVVSIDGGEPEVIPPSTADPTASVDYRDHTGAPPSWSPDGTKIAFVAHRDGNDEIYVMDADGENQTRLTYYAGVDGHPCWSPDGTKIIFERWTGSNVDIYIMESTGGEATLFIQNASDPHWVLPRHF